MARAPDRAFRDFLESEAAGGVVLLAAALLAVIVANSPWGDAYRHAVHAPLGPLSVERWIDDVLMALFFLLIGLEVKRELVVGQLASWSRRLLPGAAAVAGMIVPALVFVAINLHAPATLRGWAIPAATDIAFAIGILTLVGSRVPVSLKILLTAIAIIDDLLAILVIALFYSGGIALLPLAGAAVGLLLLAGLNRGGVRALWPYLLVGAGIWYGVFLSGVHATLAGVAVAFTIPLRTPGERGPPPLERLEHALHPWIAFLVVPLFGLANAGVALAGLGPSALFAPLPLGIACGLFLGKQTAILGAVRLMAKFGWAPPPAHASWRQIWGMATLCGIGFTMSLFIGGLAFGGDAATMNAVRLGTLAGSLLSGVAGWLILRGATRQ